MPELHRLRDIAPFTREVVMVAAIANHGATPSHTALQKEYGELPAYDSIMARRVARAAAPVPDAYVPLMRHAGTLHVDNLPELGAYLVDRDRLSDAEEIYETWIASSRDEVVISSSAGWLVRR